MVDVARSRSLQTWTEETSPGWKTSVDTLTSDALERVKQYARDEPVTFGLWAFGIGFLLGWRMKPW